MKKFVFKEARLLTLRNQEVTIAELAVAKASARVGSAERATDQERDALDALSAEILSGGQNGFTHVSQLAFAIRARLEQRQAYLKAKEHELSAAIKSLQKVRMAVESLQTLKTRRMKQHAADRQQQEQMQRDDFASRKWMMEERRANA